MEQDGQEREGLGEQVVAAGDGSQTFTTAVPPLAPLLRTPRSAGVAGIIFSVLLVASVLLLPRAPANQTDAQVVAWFQHQQAAGLALVSLYLIPFTGIGFLWFIGVIRSRIGRHEDRFFATGFLGAGLLFIAMLFAGVAIAGSLVVGTRFLHEAGHPSAEVIRTVRTLAYMFVFVYAVKMAGVFVLVCNTIVLRTKIFRRWAVFVGYVVGLVLVLSVGYSNFTPIMALFPVWVAFISIYLLIRPGGAETE